MLIFAQNYEKIMDLKDVAVFAVAVIIGIIKLSIFISINVNLTTTLEPPRTRTSPRTFLIFKLFVFLLYRESKAFALLFPFVFSSILSKY